MGYLVAAHVARTAPDVARLKMLPPGLAWDLYRDEDVPAWYIDTFKADRKKKWTFASPTLTRDFPIDLPDDLGALTRVYAALQSARLANASSEASLTPTFSSATYCNNRFAVFAPMTTALTLRVYRTTACCSACGANAAIWRSCTKTAG